MPKVPSGSTGYYAQHGQFGGTFIKVRTRKSSRRGNIPRILQNIPTGELLHGYHTAIQYHIPCAREDENIPGIIIGGRFCGDELITSQVCAQHGAAAEHTAAGR